MRAAEQEFHLTYLYRSVCVYKCRRVLQLTPSNLILPYWSWGLARRGYWFPETVFCVRSWNALLTISHIFPRMSYRQSWTTFTLALNIVPSSIGNLLPPHTKASRTHPTPNYGINLSLFTIIEIFLNGRFFYQVFTFAYQSKFLSYLSNNHQKLLKR